jgi:cysteine desulfurase family protein (TIGR01976 family)
VTATLDLAAVRVRFPALQREHGGRPVAYLDGPGGSQAPASVIEAVAGYLRSSAANDGGAFDTSVETQAVIAEARRAAADFTGSRPEEIAFGANMTTLNFLLAHAVARTLEPGDEIVVTDLDHDANIAPWLLVARDHELVVRHAPIRPAEGALDEDALEAALGPRTRVVAFTMASNALGSIPDARRIAAAAHDAGALAWADAVHLAPHRRLRRAEIGLDVLLSSPYKFFGPHLGIAAIGEELARSLPADRVRPAAQEPPGHRFETGTQSFEAMAGTIAAIDYISSLGEGDARTERLDRAFERIEPHERELSRRFLDGAEELEPLELYGPRDAERRTPTFAFNLGRLAPRAVAEALAARGLYLWDGDFYAMAPLRALGLGERGVVRAGFLHYTTEEEVDRLLEALDALCHQARGRRSA